MNHPPRISVVCFTNDPPARVAAALALVAPIAHEIIVAIDDRVDPTTVGPVLRVADRVVRAEFLRPLEANLAWLHEQATGDWVLRLDGDDVVSDALVNRLATPGWDAGITHAYVSYRWLWREPDQMLDQPPWWPDPALRLIRNIDGIVRFPQGAHQPPVVAGDARFLDEAIYHLDLLLGSEAEREAKADRYERGATGHRVDPGWSVNTTYYLPERLHPVPTTSNLPSVDAAAVAAVLSAASAEEPAAQTPMDPTELAMEHVTAAGRQRPGPQPGDAALRVIATPPLAAVTGRTYTVTVAVTNKSAVTWRPGDAAPPVVGAIVRDRDGSAFGGELRAALPGPVAPGDEVLVRLAVPHLPAPGPATLDIGLVEEGRGWHDARLSVPVEVQQGRRVLVSAGISPTPHLGDDLITRAVLAALARHLPDVVPVLLANPVADQAARFGCQAVPAPTAARPGRVLPAAEPDRWITDLVHDAERVASGEAPLDPANGAFIEPFTSASALVIAPGGGFTSRYGVAALAATALEVRLAEAVGLPVLVEGAYVGPMETRADRRSMVRIARAARRFTVRDAGSATALVELGGVAESPESVPDPATAFLDLGPQVAASDATALLAAHGIGPGRPYAVFSLRGGQDGAAQCGVLRSISEQLPEGTATVYLPHCTGADDDDRQAIAADPWSQKHLAVIDLGRDDYVAATIIAGAALVAGTRFHLTLLARWAGIPTIAMVHDDYDAGRLAALDPDPGLHLVPDDDPTWAAESTRKVLSAPRSRPRATWDGAAFAAALDAVLPPAPRLA